MSQKNGGPGNSVKFVKERMTILVQPYPVILFKQALFGCDRIRNSEVNKHGWRLLFGKTFEPFFTKTRIENYHQST